MASMHPLRPCIASRTVLVEQAGLPPLMVRCETAKMETLCPQLAEHIHTEPVEHIMALLDTKNISKSCSSITLTESLSAKLCSTLLPFRR